MSAPRKLYVFSGPGEMDFALAVSRAWNSQYWVTFEVAATADCPKDKRWTIVLCHLASVGLPSDPQKPFEITFHGRLEVGHEGEHGCPMGFYDGMWKGQYFLQKDQSGRFEVVEIQ